jgi:hypothetical protein
MSPSEIRRSYTLPLGYTAEFIRSGGRDGHDIRIEWTPQIPVIRNPRIRRKFITAYQDARAAFLTDLAAVLGGSIATVDYDGTTGTVGVVQIPRK